MSHTQKIYDDCKYIVNSNKKMSKLFSHHHYENITSFRKYYTFIWNANNGFLCSIPPLYTLSLIFLDHKMQMIKDFEKHLLKKYSATNDYSDRM